jgi:hypothetical protein
MERPILFSTPMVQAILDGRKTQTRRIVKIPDLMERPDRFRYKGNSNEFDIPRKAIAYDDKLYHSWELVNSNACSWVEHSRKPGDVLWVKEMYYAYGMWLHNGHSKKGKAKWRFFDTTGTGYEYHYCDNPPENILPNTRRETYGWFKRSSLFMPFKACRIKLQITDIRVERVQDISGSDAVAEGITIPVHEHNILWSLGEKTSAISFMPNIGPENWTAEQIQKAHYAELWSKINGKESWLKNPWVWVISFKKL